MATMSRNSGFPWTSLSDWGCEDWSRAIGPAPIWNLFHVIQCILECYPAGRGYFGNWAWLTEKPSYVWRGFPIRNHHLSVFPRDGAWPAELLQPPFNLFDLCMEHHGDQWVIPLHASLQCQQQTFTTALCFLSLAQFYIHPFHPMGFNFVNESPLKNALWQRLATTSRLVRSVIHDLSLTNFCWL